MAKRKSAFDRCVESVTAKGSADDPRAVCAVAGVRKYGQAEMTRRSIAGRRNAGLANPEEDSPRAFWKERNDGKYHVQFVYPRSGQRVSKIMTREKFEEMKSSGKYLVYHSNPDDARWGRGNPFEEAAALSEAFHGRPAESITEYTDSVHEHTVLTDLGRLLRINLDRGVKIKFGPGTRLASNEAGTQLYSVGGDQSVDLDGFDVDETKESVVLGQVKKIVYSTSKDHLGEEDKTEGPYVHELGEETGHLPILVYDTVNRLLSFVGGSYHIDIDMDGKYSAGIRD